MKKQKNKKRKSKEEDKIFWEKYLALWWTI